MIRFTCTCGHRFEVGDDQAGGWVQCPECRLLSDVPTHSELESFTDEGTYKLETSEPSAAQQVDRVADAKIIYAKTKLDEFGNEIDLRTIPAGRRPEPAAVAPADEFDLDAIEIKELELAEPDPMLRPKYDPETGELIREFEVGPNPRHDVQNPADIPLAMATIAYAGGNMEKKITPWHIGTELLMPTNVIVMLFIVAAHLFSGMMFIVMIAALFFLAPPFIVLQCLIMSHYGNVIDSVGRSEHEELPRPLRDLEWIDDIWFPFCHMFAGIMICFLIPTLALLVVMAALRLPPAIAFVLGGMVGTLLGPAVLLTTNTSGSTANLHPMRVLAVMRACGGHYLGVVVLWAITWPVYLLGWVGICGAMARSFGHEIVVIWIIKYMTGVELDDTGPFGNWFFAVPGLLFGVYLMHYFCWYVGLLYKGYYERFPWVLQRHSRDPNKPAGMHADRLSQQRPRAGHLPPMDALPPPPPPAPRSRLV
jgi:hypothetical protein